MKEMKCFLKQCLFAVCIVIFSYHMANITVNAGELSLAPEADFETTDNEDGTITITNYTGTETEFEIPAQIGGKTVTKIGDSAFSDKNITNIVIPDSITTIGTSAFSSCRIETLTIPGNVKSVGAYAFYCNNISTLILNEGIEEIDECAFNGSNITKQLLLPSSLQTIGNDAFSVTNSAIVYCRTTDQINYCKQEELNYVDASSSFDISDGNLSFDVDNIIYTGKPITLSNLQNAETKVHYNNIPLYEGLDFDAVYTDNTAAGTASVSLMGKGAYTGQFVTSFKIRKKEISVCAYEIYIDGKKYDYPQIDLMGNNTKDR